MTRTELEVLYREHGPGLIAFARNLVRTEQDAEDVVQAVFLRLARDPEGVPEVLKPKTYLFTACRNEALTLRRRRKREGNPGPLEAGQAVSVEPSDGADLEAGEMAGILDEALRALPEDQREVIHLKAFSGMSFREIAEALGLPRDTAASRYRYGLAKLHGSMERWKEKI